MRVLVLGAGVVGGSAAYALARRGHEVIVLDRRGAVGEDTSFANGGHGTLGWTMAAGSAEIIADLVSAKTPAIDLSGLEVDRFIQWPKLFHLFHLFHLFQMKNQLPCCHSSI